MLVEIPHFVQCNMFFVHDNTFMHKYHTAWYFLILPGMNCHILNLSMEPNPALYIRIILPNVLFTEELNKYTTPHEKHTPFISFYPGSLSTVHVYLISIFLCEVESGFHAELETWELWTSRPLHLLPSMILRLLEKCLVAQAIKVLCHSEVTSSRSKALSDI